MEQAIATAIITAAAVLLGVVVGRLLESRSESRRWWRDQRRNAYAQLLICEQRFTHFSSIEELNRREDQDVKNAWLAVQEAAALVDLVAPDSVAKAAKQFVVASRRYWVAREAIGKPPDASLAAGLSTAQTADKASDNRITARHDYVEAAKKDLRRR